MSTALSRRAFVVASILPLTVGSVTSLTQAETIYGVTMQNFLMSFDSASPNNLNFGVQITGVQPGELIMGIDFRPSNSVLYGLGSQNRLYTINTSTGVATAVNNQPFAPPANGVEFGFDFNPVADLARVVSDVQQNFRLNPNTGAVAGTDSNLAYISGDPNFGVDPSVMAAAYTNNVAGAQATTLFVLDSRLNTLARVGSIDGTPISPNAGQLNTIGPTGVDFVEMGAFDISGGTGIAYAALLATNSSQSGLYTINLATGAATLTGTIGGGLFIRDIAVIPSPGSLTLLAVGGFLAIRRRR
ncbi:MAG: DUF4394 domain-containing protein [Phycisphaeraceae bacterium]|nr:DUF4394 domain-containing protein [Phycisphaeraceae bacterium]